MKQAIRPAIFKWRQTEPELILCAVRWYLRYSLSFRDVEELLRERGLEADHTTIWRWVQRYGPELEERLAHGVVASPGQRDRGYRQVDEKLVDRPPRYWARASREPAMLGIKNGRRPQLDNTHRRPVHHEERADGLLRWRRAGHRRESIGLRVRIARVPREGVGVGDERRGGVGTERSLPPKALFK